VLRIEEEIVIGRPVEEVFHAVGKDRAHVLEGPDAPAAR